VVAAWREREVRFVVEWLAAKPVKEWQEPALVRIRVVFGARLLFALADGFER
jgi:hypothetical protein